MSSKSELREALEALNEKYSVLEKKLTPPPAVEIVAVTHVKDRTVDSYHQGLYGRIHEETVQGVTTIVLYTVDGELNTKDLPGTWKLEDVQKGSL